MKRRRWRRIAMWAGLAACGITLALIPLSVYVKPSISMDWPLPIPGQFQAVFLDNGSLFYWSEVAEGVSILRKAIDEKTNWQVKYEVVDFDWEGLFRQLRIDGVEVRYREYSRGDGRHSRTLSLPLWPLFLLIAIETGLLWRAERRDRRRAAAGACGTCGYDLTGNVTGRCPECGAAADRPAASKLPF